MTLNIMSSLSSKDTTIKMNLGDGEMTSVHMDVHPTGACLDLGVMIRGDSLVSVTSAPCSLDAD